MLKLPAVLTHDEVASFTRGIAASIAAEPQVVVADLGSLTDFDSSALALLLECRRMALQADKSFAVLGAPARMRQLATLYGVAELIPPVS
jgi:phospholipid transport system transporter-binding protein